MADPPPAKRAKFDFGETFDILVGNGPDQKRFTAHRDLLVSRSSFFKAARSSRWTTDPLRPTDLTDHEPAVVANYLHAAYFGCLEDQTYPNTESPSKEEAERMSARVLAKENLDKPSDEDQAVADPQFEALVKGTFYSTTALYLFCRARS